MKKILAILTVLSLVLCFAACGKDEPEKTDATDKAEDISNTIEGELTDKPEDIAYTLEGEWTVSADLQKAFADELPGFTTSAKLTGTATFADGKIELVGSEEAMNAMVDTFKADISDYINSDTFLDLACEELGISRDDLSDEILELIKEEFAALPDSIAEEFNSETLSSSYTYTETDGVISITDEYDNTVEYTYEIAGGTLTFTAVSGDEYAEFSMYDFSK